MQVHAEDQHDNGIFPINTDEITTVLDKQRKQHQDNDTTEKARRKTAQGLTDLKLADHIRKPKEDKVRKGANKTAMGFLKQATQIYYADFTLVDVSAVSGPATTQWDDIRPTLLYNTYGPTSCPAQSPSHPRPRSWRRRKLQQHSAHSGPVTKRAP